ncbi:unnamed protein product [Effrenium voratum]|nr:unnamed protein product [Effrenium voratum]
MTGLTPCAVVGLVSWPATKVPKAKPRVVIYGYHPVLIEPVAALQAELLWFGVSPRDCAFFGVLCHQRREAKRAVRAKLRFLTYSSEADEKEVEAAYKAFWEAENLRADLVLAMELRDAYFLWKVAQVATIYYPAMIFMQDEAMDDYSADVLIRQFEEFCQQDVLSGKASAVPTAVVAQSPFLAASIEYHTGRPVPHVRPLAPYVSATYQANSSTVLVLCARTRLMMSHNCRGLFRAGARLLPRGRKLRLPPGDQDVVHGYSFQEVAQFEATVLVPWNIAVTTFHELYAMHMPMFIPDTLWLARLWPKQMTSYGRSHPNLHRQMRPNDRHPTPYPSLDFLSRDFLTMVYWAKSFSGLDLPGVQRFTSIPDLLLGLEEVDLKQISREMALETAKAREQVVPFWSSLVGVLSAPLDTSPEREGAQLSARPTDSE